mgnify:CR=1 FL=1
MAINSIPSNHDFSNITALKSSASDTSSKTLQNQLTNTEQRLNRLSSDSKISAAEKAKERQKLQKQIAELNRKLRLLQIKKEEEQDKYIKENLDYGNIKISGSHGNGRGTFGRLHQRMD